MNVFVVTVVLTLTSCVLSGEVLTSANNKFAGDVYREVVKKGDENFLFSPFSAESVLAFVEAGARGETAQELKKGLNLPDDQSKIELAFKNAVENLKSEDPYAFYSANKLYLQENSPIKDDFKKIASEVFAANIENVDFSQPDASKIINQWVEEKTRNKIKDLVGDLDSDTQAILVNALYFKANWSIQFLDVATKKKVFSPSGKEVDMMVMYETDTTFNYLEDPELDAKFLELPFEGDKISMVFALPNQVSGLSKLEENIYRVFAPKTFTEEYVNISIPKFKIESKIDFKKVMTNLGVNKAFARNKADFSGISDEKLVLSEVIQKTFIDVNEDGVEAAAATYGRLTLFSAHFIPDPKQFHADHPFIYYVKVKDLVVFAGKVGFPKY